MLAQPTKIQSDVFFFHGYQPIAVTQDLYNLFERVNEWDLYPACQRHQLGAVAYAVLAGGLLSGNYTLDMVRDHGKIPPSRRPPIMAAATRIARRPGPPWMELELVISFRPDATAHVDTRTG